MKKNKKIMIGIIVIVCLAISIIALLFIREIFPSSPLRGKGTPRFENPAKVVLHIKKRKNCIPVSLDLYEDGTYELFTDYWACKPFQTCTLQLNYTKSIKGTYDYDLTKILGNSIKDEDITFDYKEIDYEIYTYSAVLGEEYHHKYVIKSGETNKYLEEFLNKIDVDLNMCAVKDYN